MTISVEIRTKIENSIQYVFTRSDFTGMAVVFNKTFRMKTSPQSIYDVLATTHYKDIHYILGYLRGCKWEI